MHHGRSCSWASAYKNDNARHPRQNQEEKSVESAAKVSIRF